MTALTPRAATAHGFAHLFVPAEPASALAGVTVLALHGTGGDERDLVPLVQQVAPGAAVLSPRGPVLERGMPRFFRRLAEGVFDLEDLARRTAQLGDFVDAAAREYGVDRSRVVAVGFSNGANIAASLLLRRPGALAGAALLRAMVPFEPGDVLPSPGEWSGTASGPPSGPRPPVTIGAGRMDPIVPPGHPERLATLLAAAGCDAQVEWVQAGHQLTPQDVELTRETIARAAGRAGRGEEA